MPIKNLLRSWSQLHSNRARLDGEDTLSISFGNCSLAFVKLPCRDSNMQWLKSQEMKLLGILLDFIKDDGLSFNINVRQDKRWSDGQKIKSSVHFVDNKTPEEIDGKSILESLLYAYTKNLALNREINVGQWQHFKPATPICNVVAISSRIIDPRTEGMQYYAWPYRLEESPEQDIQLVKVGDKHYYLANKDYGDRVFYHYDGDKQWAREKSNFLGLVGPEHPESEGLLRFAKYEN